MRKTDLQEQAVMLIGQLSTEKLKSAVDYLVYLQDAETRNISSDHEVPSTRSWNRDPRTFQTFRRGRT